MKVPVSHNTHSAMVEAIDELPATAAISENAAAVAAAAATFRLGGSELLKVLEPEVGDTSRSLLRLQERHWGEIQVRTAWHPRA